MRTLRVFDISEFNPARAWAAEDLAAIDGVTVRVHWTDAPYVWHVNDGAEVFAVLDGAVDMHYRMPDRTEKVERLVPGRVCVMDVGDEHVAYPAPTARILVVERAGSI